MGGCAGRLAVIALCCAACDLDDPPAPRDTAAPACAPGFLDDGGSCVPEACGTGGWGALEVDGSTVFVDAAAESGGDGSQEAPLGSIQAGLDLAGAAGGGMVAVAAGTYHENLALGRGHADVHLAGRCRDLVVLDASTAEPDAPVLEVSAASSQVEISGITLRDGPSVGVGVSAGNVVLRDVVVAGMGSFGVIAMRGGVSGIELSLIDSVVEDCSVIGVAVYDLLVEVRLTDTVVRSTRCHSGGGFGYGLQVAEGGSLEADGLRLADNRGSGLAVFGVGTSCSIVGSAIQGTREIEAGGAGCGIQVFDGAVLEVEGTTIADNVEVGVIVGNSGSELRLRDSAVLETALDQWGDSGHGIDVLDGARLFVEGCRIAGNRNVAVLATDGAAVELHETLVEDTAPGSQGTGGQGLEIHSGGSLVARSCELRRNSTIGVFVGHSGSTASLSDIRIEDTLPTEQGMFGYGVEVVDGAQLTATGCLIEGNRYAGVGVFDPGSRAALHHTRIVGTLPVNDTGVGVFAQEGGALFMDRCAVEGSVSVGVVALDSGTSVALSETVIAGTQPTPAGLFGYGVQAAFGASMVLDGCEVSHNAGIGLFASEGDTTVSVRETRIVDTLHNRADPRSATGAVGLAVYAAASVEASDVAIEATEGPGVLVRGPGLFTSGVARFDCTGCSVRDNRFAGVIAVDGGELTLAGSLVEGTEPGADLGGGVGIYASPWHGTAPVLRLSSSTVRDNPIAGIFLGGQGSYTLADNSIHGGEGWSRSELTRCGDAIFVTGAVSAWDGDDGLALVGNELRNGLTAGLFLHESSAWLSGNRYADNAVDLITQGDGCAESPGGLEGEALASSELCPQWDYAVCDDDEFWFYLGTMGMDSSGARMGTARLEAVRGLELPVASSAHGPFPRQSAP